MVEPNRVLLVGRWPEARQGLERRGPHPELAPAREADEHRVPTAVEPACRAGARRCAEPTGCRRPFAACLKSADPARLGWEAKHRKCAIPRLSDRPDSKLRPSVEAKRGNQNQEALGRPRGGFSTKIHLRTDAKGRPLAEWDRETYKRRSRIERYVNVFKQVQHRHAIRENRPSLSLNVVHPSRDDLDQNRQHRLKRLSDSCALIVYSCKQCRCLLFLLRKLQ
jgi:hypothetical protein